MSPRKRQQIVKKIEELERDLGRRVAVYFGPNLDFPITFDEIIESGAEIRRLYRQLQEADA